MCNESHFRAANYKDLFQTGQSFLTLLEKFPQLKAFFDAGSTFIYIRLLIYGKTAP